MKITAREEILMRRALDPASSPAEAAKAAEAFVSSLRKRGIDGYDFIGQQRSSHQAQSEPPKDADGYQFYREGFGWGCGRGRWGKWPDGSTYWEDEQGRRFNPPNPGPSRRNGNGASATPPPQPDSKWDFMREQRATQDPEPKPAPRTVSHSSKVASAIGIGIITFICFFLAFTVSHNMLVAAIVGGLVLRGLRKVNFLGN